ncbi:putative prostaglandin reductase 1-like [Apostichopus japonicus]|uniref:15-oxoprostaglandin 13-reductase n=2 Tax=Stichopus japonicus TaxID=307972 RepID=A0A2G8JM37_STIJA|nr:putative prostaglandin reductase 1-like [Apostichopus japonicus]
MSAKIGDTMFGEIVGKVTASKDPAIKVGDYAQAYAGWVTHAVVNGKQTQRIPELPEGVPLTLTVGTLGMPGLTAYFGLKEVAQLKETDTVLVNAAAGAVGSVVGQIAKIKGCKVIGSVGSDEKVKYLKEELGFDEAYNYKVVTPDKLGDELKKLAPNGIDVFFENVGGEASSVIYSHINQKGRVAVCGSISSYNVKGDKPKVTEFIHLLIYKSIRVEGFNVMTYFARRDDALKEMVVWLKEGKLKYREHKFENFESMFDAFAALFTGQNTGKVVVTV